MNKNPLLLLESFGQSIWMDYLSRRSISSGELQRLIEQDGVSGVTSNPSIFQNAIAKSHDYDEAIRALALKGITSDEILPGAHRGRYSRRGRPLVSDLPTDGWPGRFCKPGSVAKAGARYIRHDCRSPPALVPGEPSQCDDQSAGNPGRTSGYPAAHRRGDQRQHHPAVRTAPLSRSSRRILSEGWKSWPREENRSTRLHL